MKKPKISVTELVKFAALFDIDQRVTSFMGDRGKLFGPEMNEILDYRRKVFAIPGELVGEINPIRLIIWEEVWKNKL